MGDLFSAFSGSSKKAAKKQVQAIDQANNILGQTRDASIAQLQPLANAGISGLDKLQMYMGLPGTSGEADSSNPLFGSLLKPFTGQDLANTPGYQFGMDQGQLALQRQQAASGGLLSGAAMKAAERFGQDYAGTKFQEGYNRDALDKARINDFLSNIGNMGIQQTGNVVNQRNAFNTAIADNTISRGNARAAGIIGQSNAIAGGINQSLLGLNFLSGMGGGAGGGSAATAPNLFTSGGTNSSLPGFSNNMLNPNFAQNYMGLTGGGGMGFMPLAL